MPTCVDSRLSLGKLFISFSLTALLICLPLSSFAQTQTPPNQTPPRSNDPQARPQASPSPGAPAEVKKPDEEKKDEPPRPRDPMSTPTFNGLRFRSIGPAFTSGRVVGFAVDPASSSRYFVAVASGGVWKTVNNGTTWTPVSGWIQATSSTTRFSLPPPSPGQPYLFRLEAAP